LSTVKPVVFACLLFRELNKTAKLNWHEYQYCTNFNWHLSPGADLGNVMRMFYMTVGRGSALYSPMEHRNIPENNPIRLSCRAQLID